MITDREIIRKHYQDLLASPDAYDRVSVLEAVDARGNVGLLAETAAYLLADADPGVCEQAARTLAAMATPDAAARVLPFIASDDIRLRNLAGEVLVQMGPAAVPVLAPRIDDADKDVRKFAIDLLAMMPAHDLADRIAARIDDDDPNVVLAVIDALGMLGRDHHRRLLAGRYDHDPVTRPSIVTALGRLGVHESLDLLERALQDDDPVLQLSAAEALVDADEPEVLELLLRTAADVSPMARPVVLASLVGLLEHHPEYADQLPVDLAEGLLEMLDDPDETYCLAAVRGLRNYLDGRVAERLLGFAGQNDQLDVALFETLSSYPGLPALLARNTATGRLAAGTAAGFLLGLLARGLAGEAAFPQAAAFLTKHFGDLDTETRMAAVHVAQHLNHPALHSVVHAGLSDYDPGVCAFAQQAADALDLDAASTPSSL